MDADEDHPEFDNDSKWPRRLLHVPSMTSHKWSPGNTYGATSNPTYIAVSYTWGRFVIGQTGSADNSLVQLMPIKKINWPLPRIRPEHFSVDDFLQAIREMMRPADRFYEFDHLRNKRALRKGGYLRSLFRPLLRWLEKHLSEFEFLWLDIACIDQRDGDTSRTSTKMAEIGRQARIFQNAKHTYVWLSETSHQKLQDSLDKLASAVVGLQCEPYERSNSPYNPASHIKAALLALEALTADPWFGSLWTLQEGYLCNHAILLSRDIKVACDASKVAMKCATLENLYKLIHDIVFWSERTQTPRDDVHFVKLMDLLRSSGLSALWYNNPMGLLAVATNRQPWDPLDRVYGIMQVLGTDFRVGKSADPSPSHTCPSHPCPSYPCPSHTYTPEELEAEFGTKMLEEYPVLSQMHTYLEPPAPGEAWRVQEHSVVPWIAERGDMFGWDSGQRIDVSIPISCQPLCGLTTKLFRGNHLWEGRQWGHFSGRACSFQTLQRAWQRADDPNYANGPVSSLRQSQWRMHMNTIPSIHVIALDRGTDLSPLPPGLDAVNIVNLKDSKDTHEIAKWMVEKHKALDLRVLLLGKCQFHGEACNIGVVAFQRAVDGILHWRRVGICLWLYSHFSDWDGPQDLWEVLSASVESKDWTQLNALYG